MSDRLLLCRKPGASATFNRSVRDSAGDVVKVLEFAPGVPVLVEGDDLLAVMRDVGRTVFICEEDENVANRLNIKVEETQAFMQAKLGITEDLTDLRKKHVKKQGHTVVPGADVVLDDELIEVLELPENVETLGGEVSPESVALFMADGGELTDLKQVGPVKAEAIKKALGLDS